MTFWDSEVVPFDPTVASSAELLEDWMGAIQSITQEQAVQRILFMAMRDRDAVREKGSFSPLQNYRWIQQDTNEMVLAFNLLIENLFIDLPTPRNPVKWPITMYNEHEHSHMIMAHDPIMDESGLPDIMIGDRLDSFISIDLPDRVFNIHSYDRVCLAGKMWDDQGQIIGDAHQVPAFCERIVKKLGIPLLVRLNAEPSGHVLSVWKDPIVSTLAKCPKEEVQCMDFFSGIYR